MSAVTHQPHGAAFDIVLLAHLACVVAGLVTMLAAATTGARVGRLLDAGAPQPEALRRYFRPGFNWAGRAVYGIAVFGLALVAMSQGAYDLGDTWVQAGFGLFVAVVVLGEGVIWPAERRLQGVIAAAGADPPAGPEARDAVRDARAMSRAAMAALVLLVAGIVVMVAQP